MVDSIFDKPEDNQVDNLLKSLSDFWEEQYGINKNGVQDLLDSFGVTIEDLPAFIETASYAQLAPLFQVKNIIENNPDWNDLSNEEKNSLLEENGLSGSFPVEEPEEPEPKPTLTDNDLGAVYDALIEEGYTDEQARDLIRKYEINPTGQDAVTLEGILQGAGYGVDLLKLPSDPEFQTAVFRDTDGDGYNDTWVNTNPFNDNVIVISEEELTTQQKEELEKANTYKEIKEEPQFDDLEDWQKDKVLIDGGFDPEFGTDGQEPVAPEEPEEPVAPEEPVDPNQGLIEKYGKEAVDKAKDVYDEYKDKIEGAIEDPQGTLEKIIGGLSSATSTKECESWTGTASDDRGTYGAWKDCVDLSILAPILGLPLPPGLLDVGASVRDIENAILDAGKTFEDFVNDPIGTIEGWIDDAVQAVKDAWDGITDKTSDGFFDWILDNVSGVIATVVFERAKDELITDTDNPFLFVVEDCKNEQYKEDNPEECQEAVPHGYCTDGNAKIDALGTNCSDYVPEEPDYGMCDDGFTPKTDEDGSECPSLEPVYNEGDPCEKASGEEGTYSVVNGELQCVAAPVEEPEEPEEPIEPEDPIEPEEPIVH